MSKKWHDILILILAVIADIALLLNVYHHW
jgi:hypothetical protein